MTSRIWVCKDHCSGNLIKGLQIGYIGLKVGFYYTYLGKIFFGDILFYWQQISFKSLFRVTKCLIGNFHADK